MGKVKHFGQSTNHGIKRIDIRQNATSQGSWEENLDGKINA